MKLLIILFLGISGLGLFTTPVQAQLINGETMDTTELSKILNSVMPGDIFIVGENHGFRTHQEQQMEVIRGLQALGLTVSVGMEFLDITQQKLTNDYRQGTLGEAEFLKAIKWGSPSFDYYRDQILAPQTALGGQTVALNAPRSITSVISKTGLDSLTPEQLSLLPKDFQIGRDSYKERFAETMGGHVPPEAISRYFAAQSVWDDTMALTASEFLKQHPQHVLVIIVGEFHVQYGGGLPDRLQARGVASSNIHTLTQLNTEGLSETEFQEATRANSKYGPRANWIWGEVAVP